MKIIISAGGTGGHIFPAIAIADELKRQDPSVEILFVGAVGKMEMERVPKAGYNIEGLPIAGLQRRLTVKNLWLNVQLPFKLLNSMLKVKQIIKDFKPDVAVGFGGFASGPTLRTAANMNIPTVLQEQNSYAGVTNKLLAEKAEVICVAYEGLESAFPKDKIILTGNPVRSDIAFSHATTLSGRTKKEEALAYFQLDENKKTIVIMGGSLGAKTLNVAIENNAQLIESKEDIQVLWQCGRLYEAAFKDGKAAKLPNVKMRAFIDRMDLAYAVADIIIARAGALTISELCLAGTPSVLVPSPNVAEDHQTKNAMALVEKQAAVLVKDKDASDNMMSTALEMIGDETLMNNLSQNILKLAKPNATQDIASQIIKIAQSK